MADQLGPNHDLPPHLAEIDQVIESVARRIAGDGSAGGAHQISSLLLALETGEIDPLGALAELDRRQAETVRRLALACFREVIRRVEGTTA